MRFHHLNLDYKIFNFIISQLKSKSSVDGILLVT